jgi:hypothetical protein
MSLSSQSEPAQAKPENQCSDCVFIKLTGEPIDERQWFGLKLIFKQINIRLTISFNEQWEDLPGGRIKFGIKAGELRLILSNGNIPYRDREWKDTLDSSISKERQMRVVQKKQGSGKTSATSGGDTKIEVKGGAENTEEVTDKFQFSVAQVTTKGSEQDPAWIFEQKTGEQVLKGTISDQKLATVRVERKPCTIQATFSVSERDVYISEAEGLWSSSISRNKKAVIERVLVLNRLKSKLKPYVSRQELKYE